MIGVKSDHKLSTDHIPILYRSCKSLQFTVTTKCGGQLRFWRCCSANPRLTAAVVSSLQAGKDKKGCTTLPRMDQDTCLFPVDDKAVEYYFASDARSVFCPDCLSPPPMLSTYADIRL